VGGVAAVDGEGDADDEAGAGAAQPEHGGGDFFGGANYERSFTVCSTVNE
jgi:hypothetical protein